MVRIVSKASRARIILKMFATSGRTYHVLKELAVAEEALRYHSIDI